MDCQSPIPEDWVVTERHLSSFIEPLKLTTNQVINYDEPLLSVKLSFYPKTKQTIIGYVVCHLICACVFLIATPHLTTLTPADGFNTMRFAQTLSGFYQGISPDPYPIYYTPKPFEGPTNPPNESTEITADHSTDPRDQDGSFRLEDAYEIYAKDHAVSTPICIRLSASQSVKLKAVVEKQIVATIKPVPSGRISRQDAVSAYLVAVLNRFLSEPITHVQNLWNVRSAS